MNTRSKLQVSAIVVVAAALALACASPAAADLRIVSTEGTSMQGGASRLPAGMRQAPKQVTLWIGDDRSARIGDDVTIIVRLDRKETYVLDNEDRTYRVRPLGGNLASNADTGKWRIEKSAETRQVGEWTALRHDLKVDMRGTPMDVTLWVGDAGVDTETLRPFIEAYASAHGLDWMRAYLELDGYPVRQEVRAGPVMSWQEVVSIDEQAAPAGTYEIPAGYSKR